MNAQAIVARWGAEEEAVRARLSTPGTAPAEQVVGRTGMDVGRQVATAEGRIVGPDGKLYAHATTTCLIFDHPATTLESSHVQA